MSNSVFSPHQWGQRYDPETWHEGGGGGGAGPDLTNIVAWYDAADAASFEFSPGSVISQWGDKSGHGYHLVPYSATPPSRSGTLNGLPVVEFDYDEPLWWHRVLAGDPALGGTTLTLLAVSYRDAAMTGSQRFFSAGTPGQQDWQTGAGLSLSCEAGKWPSGYRNSGPISAAPTGMLGQWLSFDWTFDGAVSVLHIDGVAQPPVASTGTFVWDLFAFAVNAASNEQCVMKLAEVLIYSDVKTGADLAAAQSYLRTKWGIT